MGKRVSRIKIRLSSIGFPSRGGEGVMHLLEEERDCFGHHGCLDGFFGGRAGAIEYCDDNDGCKGIGRSKGGQIHG